MTEEILTMRELQEANAEFVSESSYPEVVEDVRAAFVEHRYPSDYRDDAPLPEEYEEGVEVEIAVTADGSVYMAAFDASGEGDGTGQYHRVDV